MVDFVGNSGRHKLVSAAEILGGKVSDEILAAVIAKARTSGKPMNVSDAIDEAQRAAKAAQEAEAARRANLKLKASYKTNSVDPFDVFAIEPALARPKDSGQQVSDRQREILLKQGIDPDSMPYRQAKQMLNEIFRRWDGGLCSFKQASLLKKHGIDASNMSRDQAKATIDAIAANGWRRPMEVVA